MSTHPAYDPDPQADGPTGARGVRCVIDDLVRAAAPRLGKTAVARIAGPLTEAVIALRDEVHAEADQQRPEIVSGSKARALPEGSLVIRCTEDGEPMVDGMAVRRTAGGWTWRGGATTVDCPGDVAHRFSLFRVLYLGTRPALAAGDVLTEPAHFERARRLDGVVITNRSLLLVSADTYWYLPGEDEPVDPNSRRIAGVDITEGWTVERVPGGTS